MSAIDELLDKLSWNMPRAIQEDGITEAKDVYCIKCFFQPCDKKHSKDVWENCARIIAARTDDEIEPYIPDMISWLEDMNWPGAEIIYHRLQIFKNTRTLEYYISRFTLALYAVKDYVWLALIAKFVSESEIDLHLDENINSILEYARNERMQ